MKKSWKAPELTVVARGKVDDSAFALRYVVTPSMTPNLAPTISAAVTPFVPSEVTPPVTPLTPE